MWSSSIKSTATTLADGFLKNRRNLRCQQRLIRLRYAAVQHHNVDGPVDAERASFLLRSDATGQDLYHRYDGHLNSEGNAVVGAFVTDYLSNWLKQRAFADYVNPPVEQLPTAPRT